MWKKVEINCEKVKKSKNIKNKFLIIKEILNKYNIRKTYPQKMWISKKMLKSLYTTHL